jgi:predicted nucleotidyltransferase
MAVIKNPNDIVEEMVTDYRNAFGNNLISIVMYGSAVTHEYHPGVSDINIAIVLDDNSIDIVSKGMDVHKKWRRRRVSVPFFMTPDYIQRSLDTYPVEFLDMQTNYRVLCGDDPLAQININPEHIRIQCERELKGAALHLRSGYIKCGGDFRQVHKLMQSSVRLMLPVFKSLLVFGGRAVSKTKADIVSAVEDLYHLDVSVLWNAYNSLQTRPSRKSAAYFDGFVRAVDALIVSIDS